MSDAGGVVSAIVIVAMAGLILVEVTLRSLFASSTYIMDEMVGYGVAAASFMALGHSLSRGGLIRMNLLLAQLSPTGLPRRILEVCCIGFGLVGTAIAGFYFARNAYRSFSRGYVSETIAQVPLWIPEAFMVAGFSVFFLQLLSYLLQVLAGEADLSSERSVELGSN